MPAWAGRVVVATGLVANAIAVPHPIGLAVAQAVLAVGVLAGWGGTTTLAVAALVLFPLPVAEALRWLSHGPLGCACQRSSGASGLWAGVGAAANLVLIGVCTLVARGSRLFKQNGAATES